MSQLSGVLLLLCLALVVGLFMQHNTHQTTLAKLENAQQQLHTSQKDVAAANATIQRTKELAEARRKELQRTQAELEKLRKIRTARTRHSEVIHYEPQNRPWADTALPADIARLRHRPAITGAAGYCEHLQNAGTLPPDTLCAAHQR
jgi:LysB family phage lysis regulatory protein